MHNLYQNEKRSFNLNFIFSEIVSSLRRLRIKALSNFINIFFKLKYNKNKMIRSTRIKYQLKDKNINKLFQIIIIILIHFL